MKRQYANYLLNKTVDDYNKIAEKFSSTRNYLSKDVLELKQYAEDGDSIFDLGCGNGRLSELFNGMDVRYLGGDSSDRLVEIAKGRYPEEKFIVLDPVQIDIPDNAFDKIYCLSVFHHIPSVELRLEYLREIRRALKDGGSLILSVWDLWNKPGTFWQIIKSGFLNPRLDLNDIYLPFKDQSGKVMANRYIHCFKKNEIEKLLLETGFSIQSIDVQFRGLSRQNENIIAIAQK